MPTKRTTRFLFFFNDVLCQDPKPHGESRAMCGPMKGCMQHIIIGVLGFKSKQREESEHIAEQAVEVPHERRW